MKKNKAGTMRLVTVWVRIQESILDPVIPATSSATKMENTGSIVLILDMVTINTTINVTTTILPSA